VERCFAEPHNQPAFEAFSERFMNLALVQLGLLCPNDLAIRDALERTMSRCQAEFGSGRRRRIDYINYFLGIAFAQLVESIGCPGMRLFWRELLGGDPRLELGDPALQRRLNILFFMALPGLDRCCRAHLLIKCANIIGEEEVLTEQSVKQGCPRFDLGSCRATFRGLVRAALGFEGLTRRTGVGYSP
jgi:hypothetical protein